MPSDDVIEFSANLLVCSFPTSSLHNAPSFSDDEEPAGNEFGGVRFSLRDAAAIALWNRRRMGHRDYLIVCLTALFVTSPGQGRGAEPASREELEFFEVKIRPVLVDQCYECHNSAKSAEGGLALDDREGLLKGGDSGPIIVPGKPSDSRLLPILRHEVEGMKMPQGNAKLRPEVIADFEKWIANGAIDPRDQPPSEKELTAATSWDAQLAKRRQWWSFQPIKQIVPPEPQLKSWSIHPVDKFILSKLEEKGLTPNPKADARTLVRRLYFVLIGMPPTAKEAEEWSARLEQPNGYDALVDHLLDSPQFGEHWARHWMDWIRYAESHGSEGDPAIDNAWVYRDYLIRSINSDVSFDQLVREHIAGDLLESPRINRKLGINESAIGPAHWRMVFHGFAPTDALEEKVRFVDDEINTFSKAFLGLTVSCARCHDHKFDPISQKDYYALFGVLASCRPGRTVIDLPERQSLNRDIMMSLKDDIRASLADEWIRSLDSMSENWKKGEGLSKFSNDPKSVLYPLAKTEKISKESGSIEGSWKDRTNEWNIDRKRREMFRQRPPARHWRLSKEADYKEWFHYGAGLQDTPSSAGNFSIASAGKSILSGIYPAGVYSHLLSAKYPARLTSQDMTLDGDYELWLNVIGDGGAGTRFVVQDYPRNAAANPSAKLSNDWRWQKFDMTYWNGDKVHAELSAGRDAPLMVDNEPRSWFGVREVLLLQKGSPAPFVSQEFLDPIFEAVTAESPKSFEDLASAYSDAIRAAITHWKHGYASDKEALLLDVLIRQGILSNRIDQSERLNKLVSEYRRLEEEITAPTRVPGLDETIAKKQLLYIRGNHKTPGEEVPRRFLEVVDATPYSSLQSGRRQLAEDLLRDDNPLTRRVIVNRLWHHLFGQGIVATPDNFGKLGQEPSHPELLDYLASWFKEHDSSLKQTIRFLVTSETWRLNFDPSAKAREVDPENRLLSHASIRRLEAELIRDSLLVVTSELNPSQFGSPVAGSEPRRSIYVQVNRNSLDPFLRAFDFPEPFATVGRRDVTNVPAQSLTMMNDQRVSELASRWAERILEDSTLPDDESRIKRMFLSAFARPATIEDIQRVTQYLKETRERYQKLDEQIAVWRDNINKAESRIDQLMSPARQALLTEAKVSVKPSSSDVPQPIGRWEFEDDLQDAIGSAHGNAREGASLSDGVLLVSHQSYVITAPLSKTVREKTLEAWVLLDSLDQRGGGVITLQTPDGSTFDSIVFGEQNPQEWMAGSNGFVRTKPFGGPKETEVNSRPVHFAVTYHADGTITGYRDGAPYGKPYKSDGPIEFRAGNAVIGFGIRHLPAGGNRMLDGRILRAELFDRALSAAEVEASYLAAPYAISERQILARMSEEERTEVIKARHLIAENKARMESFGPVPSPVSDRVIWSDLARAMFCFKEFIYVR